MVIERILFFFFLQVSIKDRVFDVLSYFIAHEDEDVRIKALTGLGKDEFSNSVQDNLYVC